MEAGADDYLPKPFQLHDLRVGLRAGRRILELQQQLIVAREALREQATGDALTGLLNRSAILSVLARELARSSRDPLSLLMLDRDHFKQINDTYRHAAGDTVRATLLSACGSRPKHHFVGRYGGEEFLIVLRGREGARACCESSREPRGFAFSHQSRRLTVTCSIGGGSRAHPREVDAEVRLREEADLAL